MKYLTWNNDFIVNLTPKICNSYKFLSVKHEFLHLHSSSSIQASSVFFKCLQDIVIDFGLSTCIEFVAQWRHTGQGGSIRILYYYNMSAHTNVHVLRPFCDVKAVVQFSLNHGASWATLATSEAAAVAA